MREIKFRGKRLDNGKWIYGDLITDGVDFHIHCKDQRCHFNKNDCKQTLLKSYKVNPKTIGQYTGLKDKNGKEIYEGDIVKNRKGVAQVIFKEGCFMLDYKDGTYDYVNYLMIHPLEIIGNICENPKLLKGDIKCKI